MKQDMAVLAAPPFVAGGLADMQNIWGTDVELRLLSVLSQKTPEAIAPYLTDAGDRVLMLGLDNGATTLISIDKLTPKVEAMLAALPGYVDFALFACAGDFPKLASPLLTIQPNILLRNMVKSLLQPHMRVGIITPAEKQVPHVYASWLPYLAEAHLAREQLVVDFAPPTAEGAALCAQRLAGQNLDLVVVECLAFREELRKVISAQVHCPVILVRTVVANVVKEFTSSMK